jgi:hypothetical protein
MPRLEEIHDNLLDRLKEAKGQGWLGEVAAIETSVAAAEDKLASMREMAAKHTHHQPRPCPTSPHPSADAHPAADAYGRGQTTQARAEQPAQTG